MNLKDKVVLVVEDDPEILEWLREYFVEQGARVLESPNGLDAIRQIDSEMPNIDLIVTDIVLPERSGIDVIMHLHRNFPATKVIGLSGGGYGEASQYLQAAKSLGAYRVLEKPFLPREIEELVNSI